jgi:hypothetical protein
MIVFRSHTGKLRLGFSFHTSTEMLGRSSCKRIVSIIRMI